MNDYALYSAELAHEQARGPISMSAQRHRQLDADRTLDLPPTATPAGPDLSPRAPAGRADTADSDAPAARNSRGAKPTEDAASHEHT